MKDYENNIRIEHIVNGPMETNTYFIISMISNKVIIVDPSDFKSVDDFIIDNNLIPESIINTHGHFDHIGGNAELKKKYNIPIYIHAQDIQFLNNAKLNLSFLMGFDYKSPGADVILYDNAKINFENIEIKIFSVPGHTPGSIILKFSNFIISGDLIFTNGIGRTDLPLSNIDNIVESIKKMALLLNEKTLILPGHGEYGEKEKFYGIIRNVSESFY